MVKRRDFLIGSAAAAAAGLVMPGLALARTTGDRRFVLIILRGGLDGMAVLAPHGDRAYEGLRRDIAFERNETLAVGADFGLNPALRFLYGRYKAGEASFFHAVASPYRRRSHFDGQDLLENGTMSPTGARDGWLARTLRAGALAPAPGSEAAIAIARTMPYVLRGAEDISPGATSWSPGIMEEAAEDFLARVAQLYAEDEQLDALLEKALTADEIAGDMATRGGSKRQRLNPQLKTSAAAAAKFLAADEGPRIAVMEATGWDSHAKQGTTGGNLARNLSGLDDALKTLKSGLGPVWRHTAVLVVTEFGRTVAVNGSSGTDHGTASAAMLVGGAVKGGQMIADWPGLAPVALYEGRDLKPTLDMRRLFKGVMRDHLGVDRTILDRDIFPDSAGQSPLPGLFRA